MSAPACRLPKAARLLSANTGNHSVGVKRPPRVGSDIAAQRPTTTSNQSGVARSHPVMTFVQRHQDSACLLNLRRHSRMRLPWRANGQRCRPRPVTWRWPSETGSARWSWLGCCRAKPACASLTLADLPPTGLPEHLARCVTLSHHQREGPYLSGSARRKFEPSPGRVMRQAIWSRGRSAVGAKASKISTRRTRRTTEGHGEANRCALREAPFWLLRGPPCSPC